MRLISFLNKQFNDNSSMRTFAFITLRRKEAGRFLVYLINEILPLTKE